MPFELSEVPDEAAFAAVVNAEHEAYATPSNGFWEILRGPSEAECTARQWLWHTHTPGSHWLQVKDTASGEVVGAAQWIIYETNPFATPGPAITGTWWPEDDLRKPMADQMLTTFFSHRPKRMNRPHLLLNICFVKTQHRRQGVGRLLMEWGNVCADKLGLEAFVESTEEGRPLYEAYGFVVVDTYTLDASLDPSTAEWQTLKQSILPEPQRCWIMWRPKGGKYIKGETKYSWEL